VQRQSDSILTSVAHLRRISHNCRGAGNAEPLPRLDTAIKRRKRQHQGNKTTGKMTEQLMGPFFQRREMLVFWSIGVFVLCAGVAESFAIPATTVSPHPLSSYSKIRSWVRDKNAISTSLNMEWSIPTPHGTNINAFGMWYEESNPTAGPPVYEDCDSDYTFAAPAADWPSMDNLDVTTARPISRQETRRPRPVRAIRRAAGWAVGDLPKLVARSF